MFYLISYWARYKDGWTMGLPVCLFEGSLREMDSLINKLNHDKTFGQVKLDKNSKGYYSYVPLLTKHKEEEIRELAHDIATGYGA